MTTTPQPFRRTTTLAQVADILCDARRVLAISHVAPDGDAVGSLLGLGWILRGSMTGATAVKCLNVLQILTSLCCSQKKRLPCMATALAIRLSKARTWLTLWADHLVYLGHSVRLFVLYVYNLLGAVHAHSNLGCIETAKKRCCTIAHH